MSEKHSSSSRAIATTWSISGGERQGANTGVGEGCCTESVDAGDDVGIYVCKLVLTLLVPIVTTAIGSTSIRT